MVIRTADSVRPLHKTQAPPRASSCGFGANFLSFLRLSFFFCKMKPTGIRGAAWGLPSVTPSVKVPGKQLAHNKCVSSCCSLWLLWLLPKGNSPSSDHEVA